VISAHYRRPSYRDLAVCADSDIRTRQRPADRSQPVMFRSIHRHDGTCFSQAVALKYRDAEALEKLRDLHIQTGAATDEFPQLPAELLVDGMKQLTPDGLKRNVLRNPKNQPKEPLAARAGITNLLLDARLQHLQKQRHRNHARDFLFAHDLDEFVRIKSVRVADPGSRVQHAKQSDGQFEQVIQGQYRK